jgi:hypothetical protein
MKLRHFTTLRTDLDHEECSRRMISSIDTERRTLFSFSGYKGSAPVIGWSDGYQFRLHKRRYWRNDFAPQCYGNFVAQDKGTLIECYFDMPRWTVRFVKVWLAFAFLMGVPAFVITLIDLIKSGNYNDNSEYLGLIVPVGLILFGIYLPKLGLLMGGPEEEFILDFLQRILIANICKPITELSN